MKVAIAVSRELVSEHFGRTEQFLLVTLEGEEIRSRTVIDAPPHSQGVLPKLLCDQGVDCLIAGGIGHRAKSFFDQEGITVYTGVEGSIEDALSRFLMDDLETGGEICEGGEGTRHHESNRGPHNHNH